jgi:hypothetical protein
MFSVKDVVKSFADIFAWGIASGWVLRSVCP